jgi:hypothetical protein
MKPIRVVFPQGPCDQKTRYLILGFERLGIPTQIKAQGAKIGVTPFIVRYEDGRSVLCGHDIGCIQTSQLSQGKGEVDPWWRGREGIFFFKVHACPELLNPENRIFDMPQAVGHNAFLSALPQLRAKRADGIRKLDVFGILAAGGLREDACRKIKEGPWRTMVGIYKPRKGGAPVPIDVSTPGLELDEYARTMATSKLALSLPSHGAAGGPWCSYRHVEAWALGVPVLTIHPSSYRVFGEPGRGCWFGAADDLSDLNGVVGFALADKFTPLEEAGRNAMEYFDRYFSPERHALHVLHTIESTLEKT